jgi:ribonuclease HI
MKKHVTIYTDGACKGNPGPGGWAALLVYNGTEKEISGHVDNTTNNRMELQAVIEALRALKTPCRIDLYTDSSYVQKGMTEWLPAWRAKNWKKVMNVDLWQALAAEAEKHAVTWHWVRGHDGHVENERVDQLASAAAIQTAVDDEKSSMQD